MDISRTHIAFLAIISLFTGIIAPTIGSDSVEISYLMSSVNIIGFLILILLSAGFYSAGIKGWSYFRICMNLILMGIGTLFLFSIGKWVTDIKTDMILSQIRWGWIFLIIGVCLTLYAYKKRGNPEEKNPFSDTIDLFIGIVGSIALISITALIFISSASHLFPGYKKQSITELVGMNHTEMLSGGVLISEGYNSISDLHFDRKKDTITLLVNSGGISSFLTLGKNTTYTEKIEEGLQPVIIANTLYTINRDGKVFSGKTIVENMQMIEGGNSLFTYNEHTGSIISEKASWSLSFTGKIEHPLLSKNGTTLIWQQKKDGKVTLWKQGAPLGGAYDEVIKTYISDTGNETISLIKNGDKTEIIKNGVSAGTLQNEYMSGSFVSNGSEYFYTVIKDGVISIVINGYQGEKKYEEVRDVFLEEDGYSYAYFARPLGEKTYCLFTRYKGNICGLSAYMNPKIGADGGSILFAGEKNGTWSIYRNIEKIVKDTGYTSANINYDYAFFDVTNPRTFLFIKKESESGKYMLIKNGILLPQRWDDVGTDVSFGFDNQIILTAQDKDGWHIVQI